MIAKDAKILWTEETDSTNLWAAREARRGAGHGTLYVAGRQLAGRGRLGRAWQSEGKGLYMTLLLRPGVPAGCLSRAPLFTAVAVCEALRELGADALIKWPNDVVIAGRKVCGILCESHITGSRAEWVVGGTGINLAQREEDFDGELRGKATSLRIELGREVAARDVIAAYLTAAERWYLPAFSGGESFGGAYRARSATLGRNVSVTDSKETWTGFAADVAPDGALVVIRDGETRAVYAADVSVRGENGYV